MHVVEDEELGFGTEHGGVGDAGADQVFLGALGHAARIAGVSFHGAGFGDGAGQAEGGHRAEGINEGGVGVGHGQHVAGFNTFPAADGGAVEAVAFAEDVFGQFADGTGEMLPGAKGIDELDVHHFGAGFFGHF